MKTHILLTIEHSKPLPDITDVICQRVWPYGGGCITDMTAAIQEDMKVATKAPESLRYTVKPKKPGFWDWFWRTQS